MRVVREVSSVHRSYHVVAMILTLILLLPACAPAASSVSADPATTSTEVAESAPTETPLITPGMGIPVRGTDWELSIRGVRLEEEIMGLGPRFYHPPEGYVFLIVDTAIRALSVPENSTTAEGGARTATEVTVSLDSRTVAIKGADGLIFASEGTIQNGFGCTGCRTWTLFRDSEPLELGFIFAVAQGEATQPYHFEFLDLPRIAFVLTPTAATEAPDTATPDSVVATAIVEPTLTPIALTPTLTSVTFAPGSRVTMEVPEGEGLALRAQPGTDALVANWGTKGVTYILEEGPQFADGWEWWLVRDAEAPKMRGWAVRDFLTLLDESD